MYLLISKLVIIRLLAQLLMSFDSLSKENVTLISKKLSMCKMEQNSMTCKYQKLIFYSQLNKENISNV